jgi:hypothetical protein
MLEYGHGEEWQSSGLRWHGYPTEVIHLLNSLFENRVEVCFALGLQSEQGSYEDVARFSSVRFPTARAITHLETASIDWATLQSISGCGNRFTIINRN